MTCALGRDGHVVIQHVPDAARLEQIVREIPDGGWQVGNSYYAELEDGRVYYKSWLYLIEISAWQNVGNHVRPHRGRVVGHRTRDANDWQFASDLVPPATSTAIVLGTWESEATNALSMKWIPSELPLGAVVLPSKQTFASNFLLETPPYAYAGLIACALALKNSSWIPGYDDVRFFESQPQCMDARQDRDRVLDTYRAEVGGTPNVIIGISAGTFVAQQLGGKLGVETHLFGTPRYACKEGSKVACKDGDAYTSSDAAAPFCEGAPPPFASSFHRNNPHDRVPGAFFDNLQIIGDNPWHDYSNWSYGGPAGADRFRRTTYESCSYPLTVGGRPDCANFPFSFATCVAPVPR